MRPRGIENILLRRVRRHQSMTALFRAPDTDSRKPRASQALPILQKKEEPTSPIYTQSAETRHSPATSLHPNVVARKIVPPSTPASRPLTPSPTTPAESAPAKMPDPVWNRLQTIFHKHQEQDEPPAAETTDMEASAAESIQRQVQEEKDSALPPAILRDEHSLPLQTPTAISSSSPMTVQRSSEDVKQQSPNVFRKAQPLPSTTEKTTSAEVTHIAELEPASPDETTEVHDEMPADHELEKPALPLESAWNVQRVEASHPLFHESTPQLTSDSIEENETRSPLKRSQVPDQKPSPGPVQLRREDEQPVETGISDALPTSNQEGAPRELVEILAPSRPRPPQTNLPASDMNIQRQSQEPSPSKEIGEAPPVNTVIGPLPADLWWLLGQKPPAAESQPDIQRTVQPEQNQTPLEQNNLAKPHTSAEHPAETPVTPTHTIQRQAVSDAPLSSSQQEPTRPPQAGEPKHGESLDLDDLARRVYAEVRRRLAAEWERRR